MNRLTRIMAVAITICLASMLSLTGCSHSSSSHSSSNNSTKNTAVTSNSAKNANSSSSSKSSNQDTGWNGTPESQRYYNAWDSANTNCTIVGPVERVYQATESNGQPVFIDLGARYPSTKAVTIVVWGNRVDECSDLLNAASKSGAWLSVTGYLSVYDGHLQFDIDDGLSFTSWTASH